MADDSSEVANLLGGPAAESGAGAAARDIAGAEEIRKVRREVARLPARLSIARDAPAPPG